MYCGYITRLRNVRKHSNADRLLCGECFGNNVIVSLDYTENQLGVYFPVDGKLSEEFANKHNLVRRKDENGNNVGGYLDPEKRNIKALKLRGEQSDGLFMPLESLADYVDIKTLNEGDTITTLNGVLICEKYIPKTRPSRNGDSTGKSNKKKKTITYPYFEEHIDTAQLCYNLHAFKAGDIVDITLKMHGTSQRTAYTLVQKEKTYPCVVDKFRKLFRLKPEIIETYDYISGTRRCTLESYDGGYYGNNSFREQHHNKFVGKLHKGEEVFYEVVGFTDGGSPIMPTVSNEKLNDKEFVKKYGSDTVFSYGCNPDGYKEIEPNMDVETVTIGDTSLTVTEVKSYESAPKSDIYVYRMTMTNPDGAVVEYSYDYMKYRCEQMGVKVVPMLWRGIIPPQKFAISGTTEQGDEFTLNTNKMYETAGEYIKDIAEEYYDGVDPIGKTHWREGVVVRIENRPKFTAYKHKNFTFKVLEGIVKDSATEADMEEAQEIVESE
jgi:hypothetical protein